MAKDFIIIIPARYKSSRFPGKPLVDIKGKTMIQRVWEKCVAASSNEKVIIATDDMRIEEHCKSVGMRVIMTSDQCLTGTDRVSEVSRVIEVDFYINVQGDEPLIDPDDILKIINAYKENPEDTFCAMTKIDSAEDYTNKNIPKVVVSNDNCLLYISRSGIPSNKEGTVVPTMKQVCIYAFPKKHLAQFGLNKEKNNLENIEDIELLRLLERGFRVRMVPINSSSIAVDTPEDLKKVISLGDD